MRLDAECQPEVLDASRRECVIERLLESWRMTEAVNEITKVDESAWYLRPEVYEPDAKGCANERCNTTCHYHPTLTLRLVECGVANLIISGDGLTLYFQNVSLLHQYCEGGSKRLLTECLGNALTASRYQLFVAH